jgi:tetratricopeptide (TPR) repeat protein
MKKDITFAIAALILVFTVLSVRAHSTPLVRDNHIDWSSRADRLIDVEDWQGLLDLGLKWTERESANALAWFSLGMAYGNLERYNDAIEAYRQGVYFAPDSFVGWYDLGNSYGQANRYNDAITAYAQATKIDPNNIDALVNLGHAYIQVDRYEDAVEIFSRTSKMDPGNKRIWNNLAIAYFLSGNKTAAEGAARELRRLDPIQAEKVLGVIKSP